MSESTLGRRLATRCDKLAANYLAFITLAAIRIRLIQSHNEVETGRDGQSLHHFEDTFDWLGG